MRLLMKNYSIKYLVGILYVVLIKVKRFIFFVAFINHDFEVNFKF